MCTQNDTEASQGEEKPSHTHTTLAFTGYKWQIKVQVLNTLKYSNDSFITDHNETTPRPSVPMKCQRKSLSPLLFANSICLPQNEIPKLCSCVGFPKGRKQNYKTSASAGILAVAVITMLIVLITQLEDWKENFGPFWLAERCKIQV